MKPWATRLDYVQPKRPVDSSKMMMKMPKKKVAVVDKTLVCYVLRP